MNDGTSGYVQFGISNQANSIVNISTSSIAPLNQWSYIVGTWDGSVMKVYFNGIQQNNTTQTGNLAPANTVSIGANDGGSSPFAGSINDVRVYNKALNADEVNGIFNIQKGRYGL